MYKQDIYTTKLEDCTNDNKHGIIKKKKAINFSLKIKFHPQGAKRKNVKTITSDGEIFLTERREAS